MILVCFQLRINIFLPSFIAAVVSVLSSKGKILCAQTLKRHCLVLYQRTCVLFILNLSSESACELFRTHQRFKRTLFIRKKQQHSLYIVLINSFLLNLLCVWILFQNAGSHSYFRFCLSLRCCFSLWSKNGGLVEGFRADCYLSRSDWLKLLIRSAARMSADIFKPLFLSL